MVQGLDAFTHLSAVVIKLCASQSSFMVPRSWPRLSSICWSGSTGISFVLHGLPTRCHSSSLSYMLGSNNIESMIIISLDNNSLPKKLLIKRTQDPLVKGLILDLQTTLLCLPSINILRLDNPIKPASWKRSIKKQLGVRAYFKFLEDCQECFLSECSTKIGRPLPHWSVIGDLQRTRATN